MSSVSAPKVVRPATLAEARDALASARGALLFRGGGTKLDWGAPAGQVDTVVETGGLRRLLRHDAADATATVQAGMRLADLQAELAAARQWLAVDPPLVDEGATVGGVFAAGDAGPRRLRYGTLRDVVIGTTVVLSDGAVGRSGGQVIKNVAGYDLSKLLCGSLGTLGLVAELVVRLHPLPAASASVRLPADATAAAAVTMALLAAPVEPTAVDWAAPEPSATGTLWVRLEGHPAAVSAQTAAVRALAERCGVGDGQVLEDEEEERAWRHLREQLVGREGETVVRGATRPSDLPAAAKALSAAAARAGVAAGLLSHAASGLHTVRVAGGDAAAHAAVVRAWRNALTALGGHAVLRRRRPGVDALVDAWGEPPSAVVLMRRVKAELDPGGRCAPGRFAGGI